jgi:ABC-type nitrate/sulfonate/bicarbonate transport system substrate-binding protein
VIVGHSKRRGQRFIGILALLSMAILISVTRANAQTGAKAGALRPIGIGVASLCSCWLPVYVADAQGFFKEQGLDAKVTTFNGGSQSMAALSSGDIQIVGGSGVRGVTSRAQGLDAIAVLSQTDGFYLQLMAVKKGIASVKDLRGKTVSVRPGALSEQFMRFLIKREGMVDSVKVIGTPTEQAELALVQRGDVDAVMTTEPNATYYVANKLATPIINFNNLDEVKAQGLSDLVPSHTLTYLARESWLAMPGNDDLTRRFVLAMAKSLALIKKNPDIAVKTWSALGGLGKDDPKIIADSIRTTVGTFSQNGCSTKVGIDNLQKVVLAVDGVKERLPYEKLATNKYFPTGTCQ